MMDTETWLALLHELFYVFVQIVKISKRVCTPSKEPDPGSKCAIQYIPVSFDTVGLHGEPENDDRNRQKLMKLLGREVA